MAVGVFTKDFTIAHGIVASLAFFLSALALLTSARILKIDTLVGRFSFESYNI
jgi:hypothetical membrane protein